MRAVFNTFKTGRLYVCIFQTNYVGQQILTTQYIISNLASLWRIELFYLHMHEKSCILQVSTFSFDLNDSSYIHTSA